jgi:hypothetical protein
MDTNQSNQDIQTTTPPSTPAVDRFHDRVIRSAHRTMERYRLEEQLTGVPHRFSYSLRQVSALTGLPIPMLRELCRTRQIRAHKTNGWWMIRRPQLLSLLPAKTTY